MSQNWEFCAFFNKFNTKQFPVPCAQSMTKNREWGNNFKMIFFLHI